MNNYLIALGSNIAFGRFSKLGILKQALVTMSGLGINIIEVSRWWESRAFPAGSGPNYVNGVVDAYSDLKPNNLLDCLKKIEGHFGRENSERWSSRTLDLDLLACNGLILPTRDIVMNWMTLPMHLQLKMTPKELILPHPRIQDRLFVLKPLREVSPNWVHPVLSKKVNELIMRGAWTQQDSLKVLEESSRL
jgi:2-amino-4-hydroxy-6-hydroxymethyldihydropteridine diphosphokinase